MIKDGRYGIQQVQIRGAGKFSMPYIVATIVKTNGAIFCLSWQEGGSFQNSPFVLIGIYSIIIEMS